MKTRSFLILCLVAMGCAASTRSARVQRPAPMPDDRARPARKVGALNQSPAFVAMPIRAPSDSASADLAEVIRNHEFGHLRSISQALASGECTAIDAALARVLDPAAYAVPIPEEFLIDHPAFGRTVVRTPFLEDYAASYQQFACNTRACASLAEVYVDRRRGVLYGVVESANAVSCLRLNLADPALESVTVEIESSAPAGRLRLPTPFSFDASGQASATFVPTDFPVLIPISADEGSAVPYQYRARLLLATRQ